MTQVCSKCGVEKPVEAFPRRRDRPSGRGTICLECRRAYSKTHYAQNTDYYLAKARARREREDLRTFRLLVDYLKAHQCVDCGEADIRVLQFDHIDPSSKTENVSALIRRRLAWSQILAEIAKCEVRCGNCHRRRTLQQRRSGEIREEAILYDGAASLELIRAVSSVDRAAVF